MCNLSLGIEERAEARGEARGKARGEAIGMRKTRKEINEKVVKNMYNKFIIHWYIFLFLYNIIIRTKHIVKLVVNVYVWRKLWVN